MNYSPCGIAQRLRKGEICVVNESCCSKRVDLKGEIIRCPSYLNLNWKVLVGCTPQLMVVVGGAFLKKTFLPLA